MKKAILRKYAELIVSVGANVRKGQEVVINAGLDQPEFVKLVVEQCYKYGAAKVTVDWSYQPLTKLHARWQSEKTLGHVENWEMEKLRHSVEKLPTRIYLVSDDPDGLNGIRQPKYSNAMQARSKTVKPLWDQMENKYQWCIAAVPGVQWAKKIFSGESAGKAVEKLWEAILYTSRVDDDPVGGWKRHNEQLAFRCEYLNSLGIETLEFKSQNGTDLRVGLIEQSEFLGGGEKTLGGEYFNPNIPTEEVFVSPKKGAAEGIVYATKPLSFMGQLIEDFHIRFEGGKAVEAHAGKNEELLKTLIAMDEGAAYLGECALVPYDSPISNSGILFWNTLFDENAACHLALGQGFSNCIKDYGSFTLEQCREMGINDSIVHEDFMIGSADMDIFACTRGGERVQIFKNGNWAF